MIHSRDLMPKYITENSRDIHTFLRLIDLVINGQKSKSDDFINILNPDKCPNSLLPILSSYLGYDYDYNESYDRNRVIIKSFKDLLRNKGSSTGIGLAVSVAISMLSNKSITDVQNLYSTAYYDKYYKCEDCGYLAYNSYETCPSCGGTNIHLHNQDVIVIIMSYPIYSAKSYYLIEKVRPAGVGCLMYNGSLVNQEETLSITDYVKLQSNFYNLSKSAIGGPESMVGFVEIAKESRLGMKYCNTCGYHFNYGDKYDEWIYGKSYAVDDVVKYKIPLSNGYSYYSSSTYTTYSKGDKVRYPNYSDNSYVCIEDTTGGSFDYSKWVRCAPVAKNDNEYKVYKCIKATNQYPPSQTTYWEEFSISICPRCGRQTIIDENESDLRLIYKLYKDNETLEKVNSLLTSEIDNTIFNTGFYNTAAECIGIILKIHINYDDTEYEESSSDVDWSINMTQSFIFGLKPYIRFDNEGTTYTICEYNIRDILLKLAKRTQEGIIVTGKNTTDLKTLKNYQNTSISYDLVYKTPEGESIDKFGIEARISTSSAETFSRIYDLKTIELTSCHEFHDMPSVTPSEGIYTYSVNVNKAGKDGKSSLYDSTSLPVLDFHISESEKPKLAGSTEDIESITTDTQSDTDGYPATVRRDMKYMNVCRSCNKTIISNEYINICPECAGRMDIDNVSISAATQPYNPSILRGSYIVDLYFE